MSTLSLRNGAHKARRFSCSALALVAATGCGSNSAAARPLRAVEAPASPRRRRWPSRRPRGRRASGSRSRSASRSPRARRSSSSAAASRPARSRATSSSRAPPTWAGPPTTIGTDGSPEQLQNAFKTALRQGADAVILNAVNRASVAKQIEQAKQQGVAFVTCCSMDDAGRRDPRRTSPDKQNSAKIGENLAAEIVADSDGKANTLFVNISAFQILRRSATQLSELVQEVLPRLQVRRARHPGDRRSARTLRTGSCPTCAATRRSTTSCCP